MKPITKEKLEPGSLERMLGRRPTAAPRGREAEGQSKYGASWQPRNAWTTRGPTFFSARGVIGRGPTTKLSDRATRNETHHKRETGARFAGAPGWAGARLLRRVDAKRKGNPNTVRHGSLETHGLRAARLSFLPVV